MVLDNVFTLLPPVVAIAVALWRKNAIVALVVGVMLTWWMNAGLDIVAGVSDSVFGIADVLSGSGNRRIIFFSLLIGALLVLMNHSGGVNAFIAWLARKQLVTNARQASLLPSIIGTSIFTDTNLSMFTAGIASQSLFDKFGLSRARLAYLLDSTCSPVSILLLVNGWGAYVLGLLDGHQLADTVGVLIDTIGYNFYPLIVLAMVYYTAYSTKVYGPLRRASSRMVESAIDRPRDGAQGGRDHFPPTKARYLLVPMVMICVLTLALLLYSGNGDIRRGSGSWSVMWAVISAWSVLVVMLLKDRVFDLQEILSLSLKGMKQLLPVVVVLVLSFAFGDAVKAYGTGTYVSSLVGQDFPQLLLAPILFVTASLMAFATGTSWGTFAVLIPIALPIAMTTGLPPAFLVAAVLGGGVFGDHSSPISDSTIIASLASGCDHLEHVKTQLPYNLVAAALSICAYLLVGYSLL